MKRRIIIFLTCIICFSCEKDITEDFRNSNTRKIAISAEFVAMDTPMIHISKTISLLDIDSVHLIMDAVLELSTGSEIYRLDHVSDGYYSSEEMTMQPGASYTLSCSADGMAEASADLYIPTIPEIIDLEYSVDTAFNMYINFNFTDPADTDDYYSYFLEGWKREIMNMHDFTSGFDSITIDTSNVYWFFYQNIEDPLAEYNARLGGNRYNSYSIRDFTDRDIGGYVFLFSDKEINGESYDLSIKFSLLNTYNDSIPEVNLVFERRDKHLIEFLKTFERYEPNPDIEISLMQPVHLYSNIDGGYGLVYASSEFRTTIDVSEYYNDPDLLRRVNRE
jgi:hypothetical protein